MIAKAVTRIATVAAVLISVSTSSEVLGAEVAYSLIALPEVSEAPVDVSSENIILSSGNIILASYFSSNNCDSDCGSSCGCGVGCGSCCCGPQYYAMGELLLYNRNNNSTRTPLLVDSGSATQLFADDLNFDYDFGVRVRLGRINGPCCHCDACEIEYLGIFDWDGTTTLVDLNNLNLPGALGFGVVNGLTNADEVRVNYESSLHSIEANCVKCCYQNCCRRVDLLCGVRYLLLDDDLNIASNNVGSQVNATYDVDLDNNLYGLQVGLRARGKRSSRWGWEAVCKAGIYGNDVQQNQLILDELGAGPPDVDRNINSTESEVSFVGELGFSPTYRLNNMWTLRGGYNLIWIEGVALAPNQVDFTNTVISGTSIDTDDGIFAHGFSAGLEARF